MVSIRHIEKRFGEVPILRDLSLEIPKSRVATIVGPSGAGKTTLLQIIGTLLKADSGEVEIGGQLLHQLNPRQLAQFRNQRIGFVFQFHHLLPEFNALENVCIPAYIANRKKREVEQKATELLHFLGLGHRLLHKPAQLSGGEQQRVAVARALINQPEVILADEPSGNLDSQNKEELHQLFFDLRDRFQQTFIIVTHDQSLADKSDQVVRLRDGRLESTTA